MTARVIQKGDAIRALQAIAANVAGWKVAAGVIGGQHGDISMPELATIHEFGAPAANIPERSFIREGTRRAEPSVKKALRFLPLRRLISPLDGGASIRAKLAEVGNLNVEAMKGVFDSNDWAPITKETATRKGHDRPLIDTHALSEAPTFQVYRETK